MMTNHLVYKLEPILDDPKFEGFGSSKGTESMRGKVTWPMDFMADDFDLRRDWKAPRLAAIWKPVRVEGRVRKFNDYPCVDLGVPAFSERAVTTLRDILEANGELLPLISTVGPYYAYNVTTVADVLDRSGSEVDWHENGFTADEINHYQFYGDRLEALAIFRIPEIPNQYYVTETFVARVRATGLQGFHFRKVWPWPQGTVWWREAEKAEAEEERRQRGAADLVDPNAQSVVVRLLFPDGRKRTVKLEKRAVGRIMDQLDGALVDVDAPPDLVPPGSLEGHEYVRGECRLFLSCPDANALVEVLRPTLERTEWPGKIVVLKRYGALRNEEAPEDVAQGEW